MRLRNRDRSILIAAASYAVVALAYFLIASRIAALFAESADAVVDLATDVGFVVVTTGSLVIVLRRAPVSVPSFAPSRPSRFRLLWYVFAVVATLAILWLRRSIGIAFGTQPGLILFTIPIALSAYLGGLGPGLVATVAAAVVADAYLLAPVHSLRITSPLSLLQWVVLVGLGVLLSVAFEAVRRSHRKTAHIGALYAAIVASSEDAIISKTLTGTVTSWNQAAVTLYGYGADEMIGRQVSVLAVPGRVDETDEILDKIRQGETVRSYATQRLRRDGTIVDVALTVSPVREADGRIVGASKIARDITESMASQRRILKLNRMYSTLSRTNHAITHLTDRAQLLANICEIATEHGAFPLVWLGFLDAASGDVLPEVCAGSASSYLDRVNIPGYTAAAAESGPTAIAMREGRPVFTDFIADSSMDRWRDRAVAHGLLCSAAFPLKSDGEINGILGLYSEEPGYFDDAELIQLLTEMADDISFGLDTLRRDRATHETEQRFRQIAENIREVFWLSDPDKNEILYVSPAYREIWGRDPGELNANAQAWLDAIHPDDRDAVRQAAVTRQVAGTYDEEYRVVRPDGEIRWIHDRAFPVRDERDEVFRIAGLAEDVTSTKDADRERLSLERQLRQAQKMEAVGQLTGGLAHDFNNLLGIVLGNLDLLLETIAPGCDAHELAKEATQAAVRGGELTRQLLAFSRRQSLAPKLIYPSVVLGGFTQLLHRTMGDNVALELAVDEAVWPLLIDISQLESAILNLAVNARDAMPNGGHLGIAMTNVVLDEAATERNPEAAPGEYVVITVSDTGTGMAPDVLAHVFEPFFTTKGARGTGLGLSMVHGFMRQSGGFTEIESAVGRGTTIRIFLPRTEAVDAEPPCEIAAAGPARAGEVILVVEDNRPMRDVAERQLQSLGYCTLPAADAMQALDVMRGSSPVDLLFTDMMMPGEMDGRALARAARALRPDLRVLFTSGFTEATNDEDHLGAYLLSKPYRKDALAQRVRAVLDMPERWDGNGSSRTLREALDPGAQA